MQNFRFIPLRLKTLLAIIPLLAMFAAFCFLVIAGNQASALNQADEKRASVLASTLVAVFQDSIGAGSSQRLDKLMSRVGHLTNVDFAMVVDTNLRILWHSDSAERGKRYENKTVSGSNAEVKQYTTFKKHDILLLSAPIRKQDVVKGYAIIGLDLNSSKQALSQIYRNLIGLTLVLASGCLLIAVYLSHTYGNPLLTLARVSNAYAQGSFETRANESSRDELGAIAHGLNRLAVGLQLMLSRKDSDSQVQQMRIKELRDFADSVMSGDFSGQAKVQDLDEIGQLAMTLNEMVRYMRGLIEEERLQRTQLAESLKLLSELEGREITIEGLQKAAAAQAAHKASHSHRSGGDEEDTVISMAPASRRKPNPNLVDTIGEDPLDDTVGVGQPVVAQKSVSPKPAKQAGSPETQSSVTGNEANIGANLADYSLNLGQAGELNTLQQKYVSQFSQLGLGQTAIVATGGTDDTYPFLRNLLESEGFSVVHASNINELLDIATVIGPQLIMVEFNEITNGNQIAVNKLRTTRECCKTSLIVLEANHSPNSPFNVMSDVIALTIPNSDQELFQMIREALAEILLVGGINPFVASGSRKRKPKTFR